jgi:hypothetical protein
MDKFKVGDKVRIKKDLKVGNYYDGCYFNQEMNKYRGKIAIIENCSGYSCYSSHCSNYSFMDRYKLNIDGLAWYWSSAMLEKIEDKEHFKSLPSNFSGKLEIENGFVIKQEDKKEILDKAEKEYLENLLRPFKSRIEYIGKFEFDYCKSFLLVEMKTLVDTFYLPNFETNKMYKGMEQGKNYTLKELGLFENE